MVAVDPFCSITQREFKDLILNSERLHQCTQTGVRLFHCYNNLYTFTIVGDIFVVNYCCYNSDHSSALVTTNGCLECVVKHLS